MSRHKSRTAQPLHLVRKSRSGRSGADRGVVLRFDEVLKIRRYFDFVRAVVGPSRVGR